MNGDPIDEGIALIGFGSSRPYNREALLHCLGLLEGNGRRLYHSFIGRESPTVSEMMASAREDGVRRLTVIPFLISTGEMSLVYIPQKLGIGSGYGEHVSSLPGNIEIEYTIPLGESPRMAEVFDDMIGRVPPFSGRTAVMLISHGTKSGFRNGNGDRIRKILMELGRTDVYTASVEFESPSVRECAETIAEDGFDRIIAVPMLLASGIHYEEDIPAAFGMGEGTTEGDVLICGRDIRIVMTPPAGTHPMMKDILTDIAEGR